MGGPTSTTTPRSDGGTITLPPYSHAKIGGTSMTNVTVIGDSTAHLKYNPGAPSEVEFRITPQLGLLEGTEGADAALRTFRALETKLKQGPNPAPFCAAALVNFCQTSQSDAVAKIEALHGLIRARLQPDSFERDLTAWHDNGQPSTNAAVYEICRRLWDPSPCVRMSAALVLSHNSQHEYVKDALETILRHELEPVAIIEAMRALAFGVRVENPGDLHARIRLQSTLSDVQERLSQFHAEASATNTAIDPACSTHGTLIGRINDANRVCRKLLGWLGDA